MREVTVAAIQMASEPEREQNLARAEALVREAHARGARIVLLPELFDSPYFPKVEKAAALAASAPRDSHPTVRRMARLAAELEIVLPVSFVEQANQTHFNAVAVIDTDGSVLGVYRKSHIPDGPGYQEKFYFSPGDTGFRAWPTRLAAVGVAICWDQWFPECARAMALAGAEMLLYPSTIGSEPADPALDSRAHWRRVMQGHAAANMMPVVAANRIGAEAEEGVAMRFYGGSFIAGPEGEIVAEAGEEEAVITARFDLDSIQARRVAWGLFRDRRPDLYRPLLSLGGERRSETD